jgi:catechol 2,3-dioxygenase-like lactoylglutathione lyase family enzyme
MTHPRIDSQITWVYTADLPGTARFYAETLGLPMVLDQGQCRVFRTSKTSFIGVCHARPGRFVEPKGVVLTIETPDVDGWHARLKAAGATIEAPPAISEVYKIHAFFARDPNGYLLEFQRFLDPHWSAGG